MNNIIRIIITDDNLAVASAFKTMLERHGGLHVVQLCESGKEAIEAAKKILPDIMLMDINMYPMNGFEATKAIQASLPSVKIIGFSIHEEPVYAHKMMALGAKGYITKTTPEEEILKCIIKVHKGYSIICSEVLAKMN